MDRVKDGLKRLRNGAYIEDAEGRDSWRALVEAASGGGAWSKNKKRIVLYIFFF